MKFTWPKVVALGILVAGFIAGACLGIEQGALLAGIAFAAQILGMGVVKVVKNNKSGGKTIK